MKKTSIFLALILAVFSSSIARADTFILISSQFEISGYHIYNQWFPSELTEASSYSEFSSDGPIADGIGLARSEASYNAVYARGAAFLVNYEVNGTEFAGQTEAAAYATTTLNFKPTFSGQGDAITFRKDWYDTHGYAIGSVGLYDITESSVLFETVMSAESFGWFLCDVDDLDGSCQFLYDSWNPEHEYQLIMSADAMTGQPYWEEGSGVALSTDMVFIKVPEPTTMLLLGFGLLGLVGGRRKIRS